MSQLFIVSLGLAALLIFQSGFIVSAVLGIFFHTVDDINVVCSFCIAIGAGRVLAVFVCHIIIVVLAAAWNVVL